MKESYLENEYAEFWIENGIIINVYKDGFKQYDLTIAKSILHDRLKVSNGVTMPVYIELKRLNGADEDARRFMASQEAMQYLSAAALVVPDHITKFLANTYHKFHKPGIPTKVFTNKGKAIQWLEQFKTHQLN